MLAHLIIVPAWVLPPGMGSHVLSEGFAHGFGSMKSGMLLGSLVMALVPWGLLGVCLALGVLDASKAFVEVL